MAKALRDGEELPTPTAGRPVSPRKTIIAATAFAAVLFLLVATAGSSRAACALCHRPQSAVLAKGAHKTPHCYACHLDGGAWSLPGQKLNEIFGMYPRQLMSGRPATPARQISNRACLSCHSTEWSKPVAGQKLRIVHSSCASGRMCDECHSQVAHPAAVRWKSGPRMQDCTGCHSEMNVSVRCATCHLDRRDRTGDYRSPWRTPHGRNWDRIHGMGTLQSCAVCHEAGFCARCHGLDVPHPSDFADRHGALAKDRPAICRTCHREDQLCFGCHQIQMPHPDDFAETHMAIAQGRVDPSCFRCHATDDCEACHQLHTHPEIDEAARRKIRILGTEDATAGVRP